MLECSTKSTAFQADDEGSIPFTRSNASPRIRSNEDPGPIAARSGDRLPPLAAIVTTMIPIVEADLLPRDTPEKSDRLPQGQLSGVQPLTARSRCSGLFDFMAPGVVRSAAGCKRQAYFSIKLRTPHAPRRLVSLCQCFRDQQFFEHSVGRVRETVGDRLAYRGSSLLRAVHPTLKAQSGAAVDDALRNQPIKNIQF